jgi:hypothetical protein
MESPEAEARAEAEEGIDPAIDEAVERLLGFRYGPRDEGFASVAVNDDERRIDLWWHGPVPERVRAAVSEIRDEGQVTVRVRRAAHSRTEYDRRADRIHLDPALRAAGLEVFAVLGNLPLSSVEIHIAEPPPGLTASEKAARCALAGRLAYAASGLPVRKVDDRGDMLKVNSPNPCGAPGLRNTSTRVPAGPR